MSDEPYHYAIARADASPEAGGTVEVTAGPTWSPQSWAEAAIVLGEPMADLLFPGGEAPEPREPKPGDVLYYRIFREGGDHG